MFTIRSWMRPFTVALAALAFACGDDTPNGSSNGANGGNGTGNGNFDTGPVVATTSVDVTGVFDAGEMLRDMYSGRRLTVGDDGTVEVPLTERKVALLERDGSAATPFSWDGATVYFLMTDRFENGNPDNDDNFGRQARTAEGQSVGTWHGGDFAGLIDRLDYLEALGVDAVWITPPVEQIRGWVGGGSGGAQFQHFPYHGYWANDFTKLDPNYGTEEELRELVTEAHARGLRVMFDMVMNHVGYLNLYEAFLYVPEALEEGAEDWLPGPGQNWNSFNDPLGLINYQSPALRDSWWGPEWVRAGAIPAEFPGYDRPGSTDETLSLVFLPDLKTEDPAEVDLPPLLLEKPDTNAAPISGATVRDYLVEWHTRWIRDFGIDAFRCDTAKHVEPASWAALKDASVEALREWKAANPDQALDDLDFWMVGEVFPHFFTDPAPRYFEDGKFDALINFSFENANSAVERVQNFGQLESFYAGIADVVDEPGRNELTYASSHDTTMFFEQTNESLDLQFRLAPALLMSPGAVQVYYGDETARRAGPPTTGDATNPLRSDMNWDEITGDREELLAHWQRIGQFRRRHRAVGAGAHTALTTSGDPAYAFARRYDAEGLVDDVVVVLGE